MDVFCSEKEYTEQTEGLGTWDCMVVWGGAEVKWLAANCTWVPLAGSGRARCERALGALLGVGHQ